MSKYRRETKDEKPANGKHKPAPPKPDAFRAPCCAMCNSENTVVQSRRGRKRYCKCRDCGETFVKSGPVTVRHSLDEMGTHELQDQVDAGFNGRDPARDEVAGGDDASSLLDAA